MSELITKAFPRGVLDINSIVKGHDFSSEPLVCVIAPDFGTLSKDNVQGIDDVAKIMISGALQPLSKIWENERSWQSVSDSFLRNVLLVPSGEPCNRADKLLKGSPSDFQTDGGKDEAIVQEVQTWLAGLIADNKILERTGLDGGDVIAKVVSKTAAILAELELNTTGFGDPERKLLDVGVLQLPEPANATGIRLYRIKLAICLESTLPGGRVGISGEFTSHEFGPRGPVVDSMSPGVREMAMSLTETMFDAPLRPPPKPDLPGRRRGGGGWW
ncbi:hypothetical protein QBC39DRAFT_358871 [Podospora conica]|nr:hypothetical protein QBC39DRAFT_358871 [Schizothecium conicum]